jgi:GntR family transcriptional regulator
VLWFKLEYHSGQAVYKQILNNLKRLIISGQLKAHDPLPSIREMARELNVNPNTAARAYRELEQQGLIYSRAGIGSFIAETKPGTLEEKASETVYPQLKQLISLSHSLNLSSESLTRLFNEIVQEIYGGDKP